LRLRYWGLLLLLGLVGSMGGVALSISNIALVGLFALIFVFCLIGLGIVGLSYLINAFRFGRREAYGQPAVTQRGEIVRSNSERVIADYFTRSGIRYAYEQPAMSRSGFKRLSRPDFYLPDYGVYVEFWGLVNLPNNATRSRYERTMRWKMAQYHRNGIKFVSLYPSELNNLDVAFQSKLRQATGRVLTPNSWFCANCGQSVVQAAIFCTKCGAKV